MLVNGGKRRSLKGEQTVYRCGCVCRPWKGGKRKGIGFTSSDASNASHATRMKIRVVKEPRGMSYTICIKVKKMATYHVRRVAP